MLDSFFDDIYNMTIVMMMMMMMMMMTTENPVQCRVVRKDRDSMVILKL